MAVRRGKNNIDVKFKQPAQSVISVIEKATERQFTNFLDDFEEIAKELSPYETGNNRSQIHVKRRWAASKKFYDMEAWTESGYGAYLELGTSKKSSKFYPGPYISGQWRPYFQPAFEQAARSLEQSSPRDWE